MSLASTDACDAAVLSEFESYAQRLDASQELRQAVKAAADQLDAASRVALLRLRAAHRPGRHGGDSKDFSAIDGSFAAVRGCLGDCRLALAALAELLPTADQQLRHQHMWRRVSQRLALTVSLLLFLQSGRPATRSQLAEELSLTDTGNAWDARLPLSDHLQGLLSLASELARLSVSSVIAEGASASLPGRALDCVSSMRRGFRLLAPDGGDAAVAAADARLAIELAKIEDVVYDVAVRKRK